MPDKKTFGNSGPSNPDIQRSTFDLSFVNNLTFRPGVAVPVLVQLAEPNTSFSIDTNFAFDFQPMYYPIQNNLRIHFSLYTVPFRICWKHYKRFNDLIGSDGQINGSNNYVMPYIKRAHGSDTWNEQNSLFDYMGLPTSCFKYALDNYNLTKKKSECFMYALRQLYRNGSATNNVVDYFTPTQTIPAPSTNLVTNYVTYGMALDLSNVNFPDSSYIRVPFYVDETLFDLTQALNDLSNVSTSVKLLICHKNDNGSADPYRSHGGSGSLAVEDSFSLTYTILKERVYNIRGLSIGLYYYQFSVDSSNLTTLRNAVANGKKFFLQFDGNNNGLEVVTLLANQSIAGQSFPHTTSIDAEIDKEEYFYT